MTLNFNQEGSFRITQVTDIHLREYPLTANEQETLEGIERGLRALKPDLIVYSYWRLV